MPQVGSKPVKAAYTRSLRPHTLVAFLPQVGFKPRTLVPTGYRKASDIRFKALSYYIRFKACKFSYIRFKVIVSPPTWFKASYIGRR